MLQMTLNDIATLLNLPVVNKNQSFQGISIDTRTLQPNNLFIALPGSQLDGHEFIRAAYEKGAAAALVNHPNSFTALPQLLVPDPIIALGKICAAWRQQFRFPIIGVTGSNGKTTVKNMLASILITACEHQSTAVLATIGTLNNHLGLPLTLAHLNHQHRYAVLEMGMNHLGEIDYLTRLATPDIAVITQAAAAHLEGLVSIENVARAKAEIFNGLPSQGWAILNRDDDFFTYWLKQIDGRHFLTFGFHPKADVNTDRIQNQLIQQINIRTPQGKIQVQLPLLGQHNVLNALAATAAALATGIQLKDIKAGLENIKPAPGRLQLHQLNNDLNIIDDTYNANPFSLQAALNTLHSFNGNKIVVLGDMKELGQQSVLLHQMAGNNIREAGINFLFTYGELSAYASESFGEGAYHFKEQAALISRLQAFLGAQTTVLIKGSRSMQMEKIVSGLMKDMNTQ